MDRTFITTDQAPSAIGTYSQGVLAQKTLYVSGQIPLDPATGAVVEGDVAARIRRCFLSLEGILKAAGGSLPEVVKVNVYLTDLAVFPTVNQVMAEFFSPPYPARAAVQVAALPRGVDVEVDAVAVLR
ncbi:MAG: Rid family detoxifying hydrolase [Polyangia bacterium]|jgi:reactive intermediate/imine deaminase|nr:Rid family detoxifying hydrolase [Polyangia bacterium]